MRNPSQITQVRYKVKNRWIEVGEDENGLPIKDPNPDPVITITYGGWSPETRKACDVFDILASDFRKATGIIVYGGSVEARGEIKLSIEQRILDKLYELAGAEKVERPARNPNRRQFKEVEERFQAKKHPSLACRVRRKK